MATSNNLFTQGNVVTNVGGYALDATIASTNNKIDALNNTVFLKTLNKETSSIDISGQTVGIEGGEITINNILETPLIEGFALETTLGTTNSKLDTLNTTLTNKVLSKNTSSIDISGQTVAISNTSFESSNIAQTPLITGFALETTQTTTNSKLDTLNTTLTDKVLNKTTSSIDISGQTVAISNTAFESSNIAQTPLITGFALETTQTTTNSKLDTLNTTLTDKVLNKTTSSIDISGQTVAISNTAFESSNIAQTPLITGFALETTQTTTNSKLDTLNTTLTNKHLDKTTDSVDITNQNINVNLTVEGTSYDLIEQGSTLWADTTPVVNPFIADVLGREGWWYSNLGNIANKSNVYWYANPPTGAPGGFQENDMTFAQLSGFYSVLTCDFVDNGSLTIPIFSVYSQPTGTNDIIPTFAHSRWAYSVSNADRAKFRKGETVLLYSGASRPDVFNELPSYQLVLASANGDALPSEIIGYMSVNTQATTSIVAYLLQYVGYLNSAVGHIKQYGFKNSKQRLAQSNLASLTVVDGVLSVSSSGGGGGGGVVQGISTTSGVAVDINATPSGVGINRLLVSSFIDDGTNNLSINNDGSITAISLATAKDADSAGDNMDIFARANRLFTDTEITGGGNTLVVNEDGSINVAGSGSDGKAYLYSGDEASAITATVVDTKTGIDANIVNVSLDTHCYGSSDGTTFHHLKTTANGNLITESKTHDGSNNPITSTVVDTKRGLDVNIIAGGSGGGNVTVDNIADTPLITGYSLESGGNLDAIKANTDKNLYDVDGNLKVNVVVGGGGGGGGGGGVVQLQAYSSADGTTPVNVYATANRLLTNTLSGEPIVGSFGNIQNGNFNASSFSTPAININNQYGNESVISYRDSSPTFTSFITIWGAFDNTSDASYFYIGVLQPVVVRTGSRFASAVLKLKGLKYIKIYNENTLGPAQSVVCTLFSG
jgi:hypothetical protein